MLTFPPAARIFVAHDEIRFFGGIDYLAAECRRVLSEDPMSGAIFVFRNRRRTMVRLLFYDGQGFNFFQKRLSSGRFRYWVSQGKREIVARELAVLLWAGNPRGAKFAEDWRRVPPRQLSPPPKGPSPTS